MSITSLPEGFITGPTGATGATGATGPAGAQSGALWTTISRTTNATAIINNPSPQNDDTLFFAMAASTKYRVRGYIWVDNTSAGAWHFQFNVPSGVSLFRGLVSRAGSSGGEGIAFGGVFGAALDASVSSSGVSAAEMRFDAIVHNGSTVGNFQMQFRQETATVDTGVIVLAGSYIEYSIA